MPTQPTAPAVPLDVLDDRTLLRWMFQFIRPVKGYALVSCIYLALGVAAEVFTTRQTGQAVDQIKALGKHAGIASGFWRWIGSADPQAIDRHPSSRLFIERSSRRRAPFNAPLPS